MNNVKENINKEILEQLKLLNKNSVSNNKNTHNFSVIVMMVTIVQIVIAFFAFIISTQPGANKWFGFFLIILLMATFAVFVWMFSDVFKK